MPLILKSQINDFQLLLSKMKITFTIKTSSISKGIDKIAILQNPTVKPPSDPLQKPTDLTSVRRALDFRYDR